MASNPSPRLTLIQSLAEEIGLSQLAAVEAQAVRHRDVPRRLLARIILAAGDHPDLTPKHHEIMYWLCQGKSRQQIADEMQLSLETVKHHMKELFRRLDAHNSIQAVVSYLDLEVAYQGLHDHGDQSRPDAMK